MERLWGDYLLIGATGQTVSYSKVYANRYFKNICFDIPIGKRALVRFYTELLQLHPNSIFQVKQSNDIGSPFLKINFSVEIFQLSVFQIQITNQKPKFHIRSTEKSGYTSIIVGGKNIETIDTFRTATQLDHLLSLFHPEPSMPAFQIQSLIDALMQRVDQLHPRDRDECLSSSASPTFVFTDEDLQLKSFTNGATAVNPHLYD